MIAAGRAGRDRCARRGCGRASGARQLDQSDALVREVGDQSPERLSRTKRLPRSWKPLPPVRCKLGWPRSSCSQTWKAPAADLDPWRPATVTEARLKALREWAAKPIARRCECPGRRPSSPVHPATAAELAEAGREIDRLLAAEPADAARSGNGSLGSAGRCCRPSASD